MPLSEKALIGKIRRMAKSPARRGPVGSSLAVSPPALRVLAGIGDDCAVLRTLAGQESLITTDFSLEGIHFRRDWHPPESVGYRCLARGLSDIAAMGGKPVAVLLSLALPRGLRQSWVERFLRSLINLAEKFAVPLAGGDTSESPNGVLADIIVVGVVPKGKAVLRSGARPGDRIFVSGELGGSAAAILHMRGARSLTDRGRKRKPSEKVNPRDYLRHFYPEPRIELGRKIREDALASAMIDTSDGLSTDLAHLCEESGVGAELDAPLIPRARVGSPAREVDLDLALHGGEDYELLFTAPAGKRVPSRIGGIAITQIGVITRGRKILLHSRPNLTHELEARGWEHFLG